MRLRTSFKAFLLGTTIFTFVPEEAPAEPISMAVAATALSAAAQGGLATFTFMGLQAGLTSLVASVAVRAALGFAMNALMAPKGGNISRGYTINELGPALPHQIIYGETEVGGAVFYQTLTDNSPDVNDLYHMMIAFAGHEIQSFEAIYLDEDEVTLDGSGWVTAPSRWAGSYVRIKQHLGSPTQTADSDAVSEITEWTTAHRAQGIAYLYCRFEYNTEKFVNGVPTVRARIKGRKVYDPRTATTAWSDNPALCVRDYLTSDIGLGQLDDEIDDDLVETAADVCEETVSSADRYTCNGSFLLDSRPEDVLRNLMSSMGGTIWYANGKWGIQAAKYVAPEFSFDEDDLRGDVRISTKHSRRDNFNVMTGVYRGPETEYQEGDFTPVTDAAYVTEDGGVESYGDLPLFFTDTDVMAQRIAGIALRRNREQLTVSAQFGFKAMSVRVGDIVNFSYEYMGWVDKEFEVVDWKFGFDKDLNIAIAMILREIDETVFTG